MLDNPILSDKASGDIMRCFKAVVSCFISIPSYYIRFSSGVAKRRSMRLVKYYLDNSVSLWLLSLVPKQRFDAVSSRVVEAMVSSFHIECFSPVFELKQA